MTDVAIKRKVRNYVQIVKEGEQGFDIYVREGAVLTHSIAVRTSTSVSSPWTSNCPKTLKRHDRLRNLCVTPSTTSVRLARS